MKKETRAKVVALLAAIHDAGLDGLVEGNHAFQVLHRIVKTGTSLPHGIAEDAEDTEFCASCFVQPHIWGSMEDRSRQGEWMDFCVEWYESLLNRGKTR